MKINENIKNFLVGGSLVSFVSYFLNKLGSKDAHKIKSILLVGIPFVFIYTLITINNINVRNKFIKSGIYLSIILTICLIVLYYFDSNKFFCHAVNLLLVSILWIIMIYYFMKN